MAYPLACLDAQLPISNQAPPGWRQVVHTRLAGLAVTVNKRHSVAGQVLFFGKPTAAKLGYQIRPITGTSD
jgi:S1-C subfamily serine protease